MGCDFWRPPKNAIGQEIDEKFVVITRDEVLKEVRDEVTKMLEDIQAKWNQINIQDIMKSYDVETLEYIEKNSNKWRELNKKIILTLGLNNVVKELTPYSTQLLFYWDAKKIGEYIRRVEDTWTGEDYEPYLSKKQLRERVKKLINSAVEKKILPSPNNYRVTIRKPKYCSQFTVWDICVWTSHASESNFYENSNLKNLISEIIKPINKSISMNWIVGPTYEYRGCIAYRLDEVAEKAFH
jgi:hypothetical protein